MNTARIVVLTIAVGAGGAAAYLASGSDNKAPPTAAIAQLPAVDALLAKSGIGLRRNDRVDVSSSGHEFSKRSDGVNVLRDGIATPTTTAKWPKGRNV
jgi:hypothetical protein